MGQLEQEYRKLRYAISEEMHCLREQRVAQSNMCVMLNGGSAIRVRRAQKKDERTKVFRLAWRGCRQLERSALRSAR